MKDKSLFKSSKVSVVLFLVGCLCMHSRMAAQIGQTSNQGLNAVWNSTGQAASPAFIDATALTHGDICSTIANILMNLPTNNQAAVIDARGFLPGTTQTCLTNPWVSYLGASSAPFATVLLPPGTIAICATWTLPAVTKIIGEGPGMNGTIGTTLQLGSSAVCNGNTIATGSMIQMGGSNVANCTDNCFSIVVSDLALDSQNSGIAAIDNKTAQELSPVQHVAMFNIGGVGLLQESGNSGPFSDISIQVNNSAAACIETFGSPRGFHGIKCTCVNNGNICSSPNLNPNAGIYVGGSPTLYIQGGFSSSIEDVFIDGFNDGIYIGESGPPVNNVPQTAPAFNNVLFNIIGGSHMGNLIHISGATSQTSTCPPQFLNGTHTVKNVCDISIMGVTSAAGNTIVDDWNSPNTTTLPNSTDPTVAMYIIGEQVSAGGTQVTNSIGYSRFTTSSSIPSWIVGTTNPPSSPCSVGDLYSLTSGPSGNTTLWDCVSSSPPNNTWEPIM